MPIIETRGPIEAWIVDDTGFPEKGKHSVGVARQYCGQLGKQDNCQVAVSLSVASAEASLVLGPDPRIAYRLYLPQEGAEDPARRAKAGVPEAIAFATKPMIALAQIEAALAADVPRGVVLAAAGGACPRAGQGPDPWGAEMKLQAGLLERALAYVVGVQPQAKVWIDGKEPLPAKPWSGRGRPPTNLRRAPDHQPVAAKAWASGLPHAAWQDVTWREGTKGELGSRFAAVRNRPAQRDYWRSEPWPELWLLVEWPDDAPEPTKYWFANLPAATPLERLVHLAKLRWRIERDDLELEQELGLGHYEGRGGRGFHHHASLGIAAYGFLVGERLAPFPSTAADPGSQGLPDLPPLPAAFVPRGSPRKARAPRRPLHRHLARSYRRPPRPTPAAMSMLPAAHGDRRSSHFMTQ